MSAKRVLTVVLGLFVIAAIATVLLQSTRRDATGAETSGEAARPAPSPAVAREPPDAVPEAAVAAAITAPTVRAAEPPPSRPALEESPAVRKLAAPPAPRVRIVVATYFHGDVRCATCRKVEAYAREAVEEGFRAEVAAGAVEFRTVNVEDPASRHFIQDFQLVNRSVVVADEIDGTPERWVKLDRVWSLVGDHDAYLAHVQDAVRGYLETQ